MGYIIPGIVGIVLFVGVFGGLLARRKRLIKEGKLPPPTPTGTGYVMCNGAIADIRGDWDGSCTTEDAQGNKFWYNKEHKRHRGNGLPAIEYANGTKQWYINDKLHREDGPAVEYNDGIKCWYLNGIPYTEGEWKKELEKPKTDEFGNKTWKNKQGQFHREDGPAILFAWGTKDWYINGKRHREDGPAIEYANGNKSFYLNGINYTTEEQWKQELNKPKCETDEEGNKHWKNEKGRWHREDGPACEFADGAKIWFINGNQHRTDGPAIELANGTKKWCINGKYHRENGPAVENADGTKEWFLNGVYFQTEEDWQKELDKPKCTIDEKGNKRWYDKEGYLHKEDGPACEYANGEKYWYINGKCHREDGPAAEFPGGGKYWYLNGTFYSEQQWKKELDKPKCTTDKDGNKYWKNKQGQWHREDGPAIEHISGTKEWRINGKLHREDGPALTWQNGNAWYINDKYHREDGPAIELADGKKSYYLHGKDYSEEEYYKIPRCKTDEFGNKIWKNKEGNWHREDGPAIECADGAKEWWLNGKRHREDGPAVEHANGGKQWWLNHEYYATEENWQKELDKPTCTTYRNGIKRWTNKKGLLHRTDGPAVEGLNGYESWYVNGKRHREDGPATTYSNGTKQWLLNGKSYTELEWLAELDPPTEVRTNGDKYWKNEKGEFHRENGAAIEWADGEKAWFINGKMHREDGPAKEYADGRKEWWLNAVLYSEEEWQKELNKPKCRTDTLGNKYWENKEGKFHREDGPAFEGANGTKQWCINGKFHREDGPAYEGYDGTKLWYLNNIHYSEADWQKEVNKSKCRTDVNKNKYWENKEGRLHREDGPAYEGADGTKGWYINGQLHREDGPAAEWANANKDWWLNGTRYTEEEWKKELNKPKCRMDRHGNKYWENKEGKYHREDGPAYEGADGSKSWWINGKCHREDGPASMWPDGRKDYYLNNIYYTEKAWKQKLDKPTFINEHGDKLWHNKDNQLHRENGPAIEWANGAKSWYKKNKQHRIDGPAIEHQEGSKSWYIDGELHRIDGPAVEYADGKKYWYINGVNYSEEQWKQKLNEGIVTHSQTFSDKWIVQSGIFFLYANKWHSIDDFTNCTSLEEQKKWPGYFNSKEEAQNALDGLTKPKPPTVKFDSEGLISNFPELHQILKTVKPHEVFVEARNAINFGSNVYYGRMILGINHSESNNSTGEEKREYHFTSIGESDCRAFCCDTHYAKRKGCVTFFREPKKSPIVKFGSFGQISNLKEIIGESGNYGDYHVHVEEKDAVKQNSLAHYGEMALYVSKKSMEPNGDIMLYYVFYPRAGLTKNFHPMLQCKLNAWSGDITHTPTKEEPKKTVVPIAKFDKGIICNFKEIVDWNKIAGEHPVCVEEKDAVVINNCAYFGRMILNVKVEAHFCETITLHYEFVRGTSHHTPPLPKHNNGVKASGSLTLTPPEKEPKSIVTAIFDDKGKISNMDEIWEACPYVQPRSIYIKKEDAIGAGYYGEMLLNIEKIDTWNDMLTLEYRFTCLNNSAYNYLYVRRNEWTSGTVAFQPKSTKKPVLPIVKFKDRKITNLFEIFGELKGDKNKLVYVHKEDAVASGTNAAYGEFKLHLNTNASYQYYVFVVNTNTMLTTVAAVNDHCKTTKTFQGGLPVVTFKDKKPSNLDMLFCDKIGDSRCAPIISVWVNERDTLSISGELYRGEMTLAYAINSDKSYCFGITEETASAVRKGNPSSGHV